MTILVVEDDTDNRELLETYLTSHGATVHGAEGADEAFTILQTFPAEVIVSDITLADRDGFAFLAELRADPSTSKIPVIALTGYADQATRKRAYGAGFHELLTKPFDMFTLSAAVASCGTIRPTPTVVGESRSL